MFRNQIQYRLEYLTEHCILAVAFFLPLSLHLATIFLGCATVLWLGKMLASRKILFKRTPFDQLVMLLVLISAASIGMSPNKEFSFYNYYHLMGRYVLLYYLVINNIHSIDQVKRLVFSLLSSAVLVSLYGFYQYLHGVDISAFEWVDGEQFPELKTRIFSTMGNPNLLAGFLVIVMSLTAGLAFHSQKAQLKVLLFSIVIVLGGCLVLTYSRGAWLSILVVIGIYGKLYNRKIFVITLCLLLALVLFHNGVLERFVSIASPTTDSSSALRIALWESTLAMIIDKPILGIGWGAYWMVYPKYDFFLSDPTIKMFHAHNMYLHIAAEIGIPGLMVFLAILYGHTRKAMTVLNLTQNCWVAGLMLGVVASILGIAISGLTDYIMYNIQMSMLFWLLNAIVVTVWQSDCRYNR
ncbi:MAG TPA: O-antigen ligase family protein [Methylomusa anaerophila]|uniref:O-antigen ligase family protein n=1 Tax=Methylomusa anaerophila TaxID=1930071 RepID=UPI001E5DC797|nr:O-antigen ligase family protein [Methylomusa anaerophila]HML89182.1 O-antigen ligase family protein [Methylomusa anaerophila]